MNNKTVILGDVCKVDYGFAFESSRFSQNEEDIHLVKGSNLGHRIIDWNTAPRWSIAEYEQLKRYELINGDVVLAMDRPIVQDNLKFAWIKKGDPKSLLVQRVARLQSNNNNKLDSLYLRYIISNPSFKEYIETIITGVNIPHISGSDIKKYNFTLPELPIQKKIAAILSAYDDLIENNLKQIRLLEEMAQITYQEWFVRLKFPNHENTPIDEITGLPIGWEYKKLGDCCDIIMGQSPKSEFYNNEEIGLPFHQGVKDYGDRFPLNTCWSTEGYRKANKGDILFSVRAPVGRLNVAIEEIILGRGLSAIRHKQDYQGFLFYQLQNIFFQDNLMGGGTIFNSITKNDMFRIEIICPNEELVKIYNSFAEKNDKLIECFYKQNQFLKEARDILLPRLMTGKITVGADLSALCE